MPKFHVFVSKVVGKMPITLADFCREKVDGAGSFIEPSFMRRWLTYHFAVFRSVCPEFCIKWYGDGYAEISLYGNILVLVCVEEWVCALRFNY